MRDSCQPLRQGGEGVTALGCRVIHDLQPAKILWLGMWRYRTKATPSLEISIRQRPPEVQLGAVLGSVAPGQFDRLGLAARRAPLERAGRHRGQPHSIPRGNSATLPSAPRAGDVPGPKWIRESATPTETGRSAVAHVSSRGRSPGSVASAGNSAAEGPGPVTLPSASHRGFLGAEWQFEIRGPIWKNWA